MPKNIVSQAVVVKNTYATPSAYLSPEERRVSDMFNLVDSTGLTGEVVDYVEAFAARKCLTFEKACQRLCRSLRSRNRRAVA